MQNSSKSPGGSEAPKSKLWRAFGLALVVIALLATVSVLFYLEEDWRGKSDWQSYQRQAEARGVEFDYSKFTPPAVPDDQNFATTPFLAPVMDLKHQPYTGSPHNDEAGFNRAVNFARDFINAFDESNKDPHSGQLLDLVALARQLDKKSKSPSQISADSTRERAAYAVLQNMDSFKPVLDELRAASQRPYARFNVYYDEEDPAGILLPHLAVVKRLSQVFTVRASAELAIGKNDSAFDDAQMVFYLADTIREEPTLISHLVRLRVLRFAQQIVWEGLSAQKWSDAQLQGFQKHLENPTLLKELKRSFEAERSAFGTRLFDLMRTRPGYIRNITENKSADQAALAYAPKGWLYLEEISYHSYFDNDVFPGFNEDATQIHPKIIGAAALNNVPGWFSFPDSAPPKNSPNEHALSRLSHHTVLRNLLASALSPIFLKSAFAQTGQDEANVACALERYRLANGKLPDTLEPLVPKYLTRVPIDVCNGEPLKYHPKGGNTFLLYSVGWNETDDGGTIAEDSATPPQPNPKQGDWAWPEYSAN